MGVALGWMALALAAVAGAPDAGRGGVPIKYTVRYMEADGVEWREAVFARLTPVTRQGSATVWTAPHDVANRLVEQAKKSPPPGSCRPPRSSPGPARRPTSSRGPTGAGDPGSLERRRELRRDEAGDGPHRLGRDLMGRKLDQGVLVQMVLQDTQILAVHRMHGG